jgi:hypothetical protein
MDAIWIFIAALVIASVAIVLQRRGHHAEGFDCFSVGSGIVGSLQRVDRRSPLRPEGLAPPGRCEHGHWGGRRLRTASARVPVTPAGWACAACSQRQTLRLRS